MKSIIHGLCRFCGRAVLQMRPNHAGLWRVIYIARGEDQAREIEALLEQAGFLCQWKPPQPAGARGEDIEIRALESEAEEARLYLMDQGL